MTGRDHSILKRLSVVQALKYRLARIKVCYLLIMGSIQMNLIKSFQVNVLRLCRMKKVKFRRSKERRRLRLDDALCIVSIKLH